MNFLGLKILKGSEYELMKAKNNALNAQWEKLLASSNAERSELLRIKRDLQDELAIVRQQLRELQSCQLIAKRLDRKGLINSCKSCHDWVASISENDEYFQFQHKATNEIGDHLYLNLPKQGIRCQRLSQLDDLLVPREFPELTEALGIDHGIQNLHCKYIPLHQFWWRRRDDDESSKMPIDLYVPVLRSESEYNEDPFGFLVIIDKSIGPRDNERLTNNLAHNMVTRIVWSDGEKVPEPLVFFTDDADIYLTYCHDSSDRAIDSAGLSGRVQRKNNHRWLGSDTDLFDAYKMRWRLSI